MISDILMVAVGTFLCGMIIGGNVVIGLQGGGKALLKGALQTFCGLLLLIGTGAILTVMIGLTGIIMDPTVLPTDGELRGGMCGAYVGLIVLGTIMGLCGYGGLVND